MSDAQQVGSLSVDSRVVGAQQQHELTMDDLWIEKAKTMTSLRKRDEVDGADGEHLQESQRLIELYGEGENGDVRITTLDDTVVVFAHGVPFSFPRLVRNGAFIQVLHFGNGGVYRLEFRTKPLPAPDGLCHMLLTKGPDVEQFSSEEEFCEYTEREDWSMEAIVAVKPK
jgi:hypothetical protein